MVCGGPSLQGDGDGMSKMNHVNHSQSVRYRMRCAKCGRDYYSVNEPNLHNNPCGHDSSEVSRITTTIITEKIDVEEYKTESEISLPITEIQGF